MSEDPSPDDSVEFHYSPLTHMSEEEVGEFSSFIKQHLPHLTDAEGVNLPDDYGLFPVKNQALVEEFSQYSTNDLMGVLVEVSGKDKYEILIDLSAKNYEATFALRQEINYLNKKLDNLTNKFDVHEKLIYEHLKSVQSDLVNHNKTINNQLNLIIRLLTKSETISLDEMVESEPIKPSSLNAPPTPPNTSEIIKPVMPPTSLRGSIIGELKELFEKNKKKQDQDKA